MNDNELDLPDGGALRGCEFAWTGAAFFELLGLRTLPQILETSLHAVGRQTPKRLFSLGNETLCLVCERGGVWADVQGSGAPQTPPFRIPGGAFWASLKWRREFASTCICLCMACADWRAEEELLF